MAATTRNERRKRWLADSKARNAEVHRAWCAANVRRVFANMLRLDHGLTVEDYARMMDKQDCSCAICARPAALSVMCVDHDHVSGTIRGLLCRPCNMALGLLGDSPHVVAAASHYLRRTGRQLKLVEAL